MKGVSTTKQAGVFLTAEQWEMYTCAMDCTQAAREINEAIEVAFNDGLPRNEVEKRALAAMKKWDNYGAMDSEPLYHLDEVLDELYR